MKFSGSLKKVFRLNKRINFHPDRYYAKREKKGHFIIHHYCPHTFNAGDHFVILSIRKHLQKYLPNCTFVPKAVAGNRGWGEPIGLIGQNIYNSNKYADAVLVGGSDQYNDWSPKIKAEEIRHLVPPLFLIGLGVSSQDLGQTPFLKDRKYENDIIETNNKAALSSVRDENTQEFLENIGFHKSVITGCPALFLFDKTFEVQNSNSNVLFTFPYPLIHNTKDLKKKQKFDILYDLTKEIIRFVQAENLKPVIVCHDDRDVPRAQDLFPDNTIFFSNYPQEYFDLYRQARLVFGSRLHATILSASLGIPFVNINLDLRGTGFTKTFKLTEWNIDYNDERIAEKSKNRISAILEGNSESLAEFILTKNKYREIFDEFMRNTAREIRDF